MLSDTLPPPVLSIFDDDEPRARRTDRDSSSDGADRSAKNRAIVKHHVLHLLAYKASRLSGNEINERYALAVKENGWVKTHPDTPRKRAGELVKKYRYLDVEQAKGGAIYSINDAGLEALTKGVFL